MLISNFLRSFKCPWEPWNFQMICFLNIQETGLVVGCPTLVIWTIDKENKVTSDAILGLNASTAETVLDGTAPTKMHTEAKGGHWGFLLYTFRFHAVILWCPPFCLLLFVRFVLDQVNQILKCCWNSPYHLIHGFTCSRETRLIKESNLRICVNIEISETVKVWDHDVSQNLFGLPDIFRRWIWHSKICAVCLSLDAPSG